MNVQKREKGPTKIKQVRTRGRGSKVWLFCDNVTIDWPHGYFLVKNSFVTEVTFNQRISLFGLIFTTFNQTSHTVPGSLPRKAFSCSSYERLRWVLKRVLVFVKLLKE